MRVARFACLLTATIVLASCGEDGAAVSEDGREASGEVLEGSISDEMLPLEELRSQAPLAEPTAGEQGAAGAATGASQENEGDTPAVEASEDSPSPTEPESAPED